MPFTPLHIGPGLLLKSLCKEWFSLTVFVFVQILIDLEVLIYMWLHQLPIHRFFHTFLGASLVFIAGVYSGRPLCLKALELWNQNLSAEQAKSWAVETVIPMRAAFIASAIGAYSHILLDSMIHSDMKPVLLFRGGDFFSGMMDIGHMDLLCLGSGLAGLIFLAVQRKS